MCAVMFLTCPIESSIFVEFGLTKFCKQLIFSSNCCTVNPFSATDKSWSFAVGIDQYQTAQNVQSDLDQCRPILKSDVCGTIICGTLWVLFTVVERGRF